MSDSDCNSATSPTDERVRELQARVKSMEEEMEDLRDLVQIQKNVLENVLGLTGFGNEPSDLIEASSKQDFVTNDELLAETETIQRDRAKITRRLVNVEEELGVDPTDAAVIETSGEDGTELTRLGRLVKFGPGAVTENPSAVYRRARALYENWSRWGSTRSDKLARERRLASKKHDLKTHLEDELDEKKLQWNQVYRAMEKVADLSDGVVDLREGGNDEGKYVLVHEMAEEGQR